MQAFAKTDVGQCRQMNQDTVYQSIQAVGCLPNLFLVADGMGGHQAGDFASHYAVTRLVELLTSMESQNPVNAFQTAIEQVNHELYQRSLQDEALHGMGTTVVACAVVNSKLYVANVGDSRLYIYGDKLTQITKDHSWVEEMVAEGKMEKNSEAYRNQKNIITRAVGVNDKVEIDYFEIALQNGEWILMCSDGLTNMVDDRDINTILSQDSNIEQKACHLIRNANENGGRDNISVILKIGRAHV